MQDFSLSQAIWQIEMAEPQNGGTTLGLSAIGLLLANNSNIATVSGNGSGDAQGVNPGNLFDGSAATNWTATNSFKRAWVQYTHGSAAAVVSVTLTSRNDASFAQAPTWVHVYLVEADGTRGLVGSANLTGWTQNQTKTFALDVAAIDSFMRWRIDASRIAGSIYAPIDIPPPASLPIKYSTLPSKASPQELAGKTNLTGPLYVFIDSDPAITHVDFWVDSANPSNPGEAATHVENFAPWDLFGTSSTTPFDPIPLDLTTLSNGTHSISAKITYNGVVQPAVTASFTVQNTVASVITWKSGFNLGTNITAGYFDAFDAWRGRPSNYSTVNAIMYSVEDLYTNPAGGWGFKWWKQLTPTTGVWLDYWTQVAWLPADMMVSIQIAPASAWGYGAMFGKDQTTKMITAANEAQYDTMMMNQIAGANDAKWFNVGVAAASRGRHGGNTMYVLGHEFNGRWYPWGPTNIGNANWIAMWRKAALNIKAGFRSILPNGTPPLICWCYGANGDPAKGTSFSVGPSVWACYPGDDAVDVIGVHHYDTAGWPNYTDWRSFRTWQNSHATAADQARARGKLLMVGEWNIINAPSPDSNQRQPAPAQDNTTFVEMMWNYFMDNRFQNDGVSTLLIGESNFFTNTGASNETKYLFPVNDGSVNPASRNINAGNLYKRADRWGS